MDSPIKTQGASLHFGDGPVSLDEMHNLTDAWTLTDQTAADVLALSSIDCKLAMELVFKGVSK